MSTQSDDASRLRFVDVTLIGSLSRIEQEASLGMPCQIAQTKSLTQYPTSARQFYACSPLTVLGSEVEGATGTLALGGSVFFALNLGSAVPPVGTSLLVTFVDNRWVFRYDG